MEQQQNQPQQQQKEEEKKNEPKKFTRRDKLIELEKQAQTLWATEKTYYVDPKPGQKKFFVTFPYPYLNGRLHMGHMFSMSKSDFTARYKKLMGYNTLFPFGFHCTGMPICAAADKLKREISEFGNPPKFPPKTQENKVRQYEIMQKLEIADTEIPNFQDPYYWTTFFPKFAIQDLIQLGAPVDFRRSFVTTDINPYYNSFIEWQFTLLKEQGLIKFGKRPSIFCIKDNQMCADHDRSEGEGLGPTEFTLIKLKILDLKGPLEILKGREVFLVAATLRPETMYGQTNCYILPTGLYGAFEMKNNEVFICSERAVRNMAYQEMTKVENQIIKICDIQGKDLIALPLKAPYATFEKVYSLPMMTISMNKGTGVVTSVPSDAPDDWAALRDLQQKPAFREKYGVTEDMVKPFQPVPIIDIPELGNLAALKACDDFKVNSQNDKAQLEKAKDLCYQKGFYSGVMLVGKYKGMKVYEAKNLVRKDMIDSNEATTYYEPEGLIISRSQDECIVALCDQWYLRYEDENWKKVVKEHLNKTFVTYSQSAQQSFLYTVDWLKEWGCSRSYGLGTRLPFDKQYLIESLSDSTIYMAYYTIVHYLQGDIRGSTPGTLNIKPEELNRETWDYIFLGAPYKEGIKIPEDKLKTMRQEFEYWYPMDLRCSAKDLVRNHLTMCLFNHAAIWKDSSKWPRGIYVNGYINVNGEKMSKGKGNFFTVFEVVTKYGADASRFALAEAGDTVDDANFTEQKADESVLKLSTLEMWMKDEIKNFANMRDQSANKNQAFFDKAFESQIYSLVTQALKSYDEMKFRDVCKYGFHEFINIKEEYLINCDKEGPRKDLILKWIEWQLVLLYPIAPHFCEIAYRDYFYPNCNDKSRIPQFLYQYQIQPVDQKLIDYTAIKSYLCFQRFLRNMRLNWQKAQQTKKGGKKKEKDQQEAIKFSKCIIIYASEYPDWQKEVLVLLSSQQYNDKGDCETDWKKQIKENKEYSEDLKKRKLQFGSYVLEQYKEKGKEIFDLELGYNELEVIKNNQHWISKETGVEKIEYVTLDEASKSQDKVFLNAVKDTVPGKAQVIFVE